MENSSKERQQLLRMALMGNALFSTISGLTLMCGFSVCQRRLT